jgi:lysophospholipase L1-like esterase
MAAMGDSITAGFLASTNLAWFNGTRSTQQEMQSLEDLVDQAERSSFNPENITGSVVKVFENRKTLSWATGRYIPSQFELLKTYLQQKEPGAKIAAYNVALSGGVTQDLFSQADLITAKMKTGKFKELKYVTLLIGNNDVCHGASLAQIKSNLHEVFRRLSQAQTSTIRVLMSSVPRIPDLGQPNFNESKTVFDLTCHAMRNDVTHTCTSLVSWTTQAQYQNNIAYVQSVNEALMESALDAHSSFPNLNVAFSNSLFNETITPNGLAVDCFHPNTVSQARISQMAWQDQPWFH